MRIKSVDELKALRDKLVGRTELRITGECLERTIVSVGMGTCGIAAGAPALIKELFAEVHDKAFGQVAVIATGCMGSCNQEPIVEVKIVDQEPVRYAKVDATLAHRIIAEHVLGGKIIQEAVLS